MTKTNLALVLFAAAVVIGSLIEPRPEAKPPTVEATPPPEAAAAPEPKAPDLELLEMIGESGEYTSKITGRVRNNSGKTYTYAQVVFTLFNDADEQVGSAMANVNGLEPGQVWRFEAVALAKDFSRFKLDKVSGF